MESWRKVWRECFGPQLTIDHLIEIKHALVTDDPRLIQGNTCEPPPMQCVQNWPVERACLIGLCGVIENGGWGEATVGDVANTFERMCQEVDEIAVDLAACRHLLNWFDETPRDEMRLTLLPEVELAIASKETLMRCE
jgi:hypothetical protein